MIGNLIKNIIIPEKIGNYYLLSQRILGFSINKATVHATQILMQGTKITLERFLVESVTTDLSIPYADRVSQALKKIISQADKYDTIRTSLPSSTAIFKELTLPFLDEDKISMVLNYEVEPFLPFPAADAIIDFVITKKNKEQNSSDIFVCAVRKEHIAEHLHYFQLAGLDPLTITIDLFDIYGLYSILPVYAQQQGACAIIDFESNATSIAYLVDHKLSLIRTLPKGINALAKVVAQKISSTPQDTLEKIIRFGLEQTQDDAYNSAMREATATFAQEIRFTLDSFVAQKQTNQKISTVLLLGSGAELTAMIPFLTEQLGIACHLFDVNNILTLPGVRLKKGNKIPPSATLSLSTALMTPTTQKLNLKKQDSSERGDSLFAKQLITAAALSLLLIVTLAANNFLRIRALKKEAQASEQEVITTLKKLGLTNAKSLSIAMREAEEKVAEEETIWFAFSQQTRVSFLKYLEKLSTIIDRKALGLHVTKLIISQQEPSSLTLDGDVRDFDALKILERELKNSGLFTNVPSLQTTKFTLQMPLKKNGVTK